MIARDSQPSRINTNALARSGALVSCGAGLLVVLMTAMAARQRDGVPPDTIDSLSLATIPLGLPEVVPTPEDNRYDPRRVELGRRLFFDPILSADHDRACSSCHDPSHGFASADAKPADLRGGTLERNAPTLFNRAFGTSQMWDGRFETLEQQALMPISDERELGLPLEEALNRLREDETYAKGFMEAFGHEADEAALARALASFVRRLLHGDTAMDHFRQGRVHALTTDERAGMWIFQSKAGCWRCHHGFNFTDEDFHNTGVGVIDGAPEPGRMDHTNEPSDAGAFKTPTLRALLDTAPYFHDGSVATLREVIEFYDRGGEPNANLDSKMKALELTEREIDLLVTFLGVLSKRSGE